MKYKKTIITLLIFLLLIGIAFLLVFQKLNQTPPTLTNVAQHYTNDVSYTPKHFTTEATIGGIGDILIHDWVYNDAKTNGGYDFNPMFAPVKDLLQKPDFLIANQESVPGGEEIGISSYPSFNSPYEIVDAIMNAGVDMVTTANNHMLDRGEKAIVSAIDYYEKKNLPYTGSFKSPEDKEIMRIMTVNGIRIAVLAYSYGTNGIPIPEGKDYLVSMLEPDKVLKDIEEAKGKSDIVLLALHWGDEYIREPNQNQKDLAHQFIEAGADIIFGHHPHVLQPIEWIEKPDGQKGLVIYSLGNFLSGQIRDYKDIGGMIEVTLEKNVGPEQKNTTIKEVNFYPTFSSSQQFRNYRVYPIDEAKEKGFTNHNSKVINDFMFSK
ncbi:CapA family protein [Bacillus niameyensis]|uniref:CapA family protein n=1 Tax=Bacillus niameyensis TaxID=1522308 RepID=UPI000784009D|nr:CapA family protein [Bacillus niameyensis]